MVLTIPGHDPRAGHGKGMCRVVDKYAARPVDPSIADLDLIIVDGADFYLVDADGAVLIWSA